MKTGLLPAFSLRLYPLLLASAMLIPISAMQASTVAYWRFEEGPAGAPVPHGGKAAGVFYPGTADSSGNGNSLSVWEEGWAGYAYRAEVPGSTVPSTDATNNFSVQNTGGYPVLFTDSNSAMRTMTPAQFTLEVSFKPESGGWRTLVGRDSRGTCSVDTNLSALYLQITPENAVAIKFCDVAGYWHQAISAPGIIQGFDHVSDPTGLTGWWYHMAAVSDGSTLSLYLDCGFGCRLVAQADLTASGSPNVALTAGLGSGADWVAGTWTVGRGLYAGAHSDRAFGFIDEVRISDTALPPEQLLFWRPPLPLQVTSSTDNGPGSLRIALLLAEDGDTITFSNSLSGTILLLTSGQLLLDKSVNIDGSALANGVTIDGNANGRVFELAADRTVVLDSITLTNGKDATDGGGVYSAGTLTLNRCTLAGNVAGNDGGGVYNAGTLTVNCCTFMESAAGRWGGGILNIGTLTVYQSTFTANNCEQDGGAGIDVEDGVTTIDQSTLCGNFTTGSSTAGGIYVWLGLVTINNSIVAGNTAPDIRDDGGGLVQQGNNLTAGMPLLAPLGNYGGPTPTMPPLPGSPAIDGCMYGTAFATDQRGVGFPRIVGAHADIGAVESGNPIPALLVNTAVDEIDGIGMNAVSLRDAIAYAPSGSTIIFAPALSGATILLTHGQLTVPNSVNILGPGPGALTVSGNGASRVFEVTGTNVLFSGLTIANGNTNLNGAGINVASSPGGSLALNNCALTNNSTSMDGGGIFNGTGVTLTVSNCTFSANNAIGSGGGICNSNSALTVIASTLSGNSAGFGGAIMNNGAAGSATLTLLASTISSNSAFAGGGGILNWGESGGATLTINASTFSGNWAYGSGGGAIMNNNSDGTGTMEIGDTILQAGIEGATLYNYSGPVISDGYNLSSDGGGDCLTNATDQINADPLLGPLQDNGGPTWTHALLPGSPAIDQGKRDAASDLVSAVDQRGLLRPVDLACFPNPSGGDGSDIGAFELQSYQPLTFTVTSTNDSGPGSLRNAIASAANGDTIDATGVSGTITLTNGHLDVAKSVNILGPGAGLLTVSGNHASRVFYVIAANVAISGLTIADGGGANFGTGIRTGGGAGSRLTIDHCVITNNSTTLNGGGIFNDLGTTMTLSNCTISGNSAPGGLGGGVVNRFVLTVVDSLVSGNSADTGGGGIYNYDTGTLTVNQSTLSGNSTATFGGGIFSTAASLSNTVTVLGSTLSCNQSVLGGAIYLNGGILTLSASTLSSNSADLGGGILADNYATLRINAATFSGNFVVNGGAGGAILNNGTTLEIGDTILNAGSSGANLEYWSGTITSAGYNLSSDAAGGDDTQGPGGFLNAAGDIRNTDPQLGPLQDNGGPTPTHALLLSSPAIDHGKRDAVPALARAADQRGLTRPLNVAAIPNALGGDGSDIGAYELQPRAVTSTDESGPGSLREALAAAVNGDMIDAGGVTGMIILTNGELAMTSSVTIAGPGPGALTVSGNNSSRVFKVTGTNVTIRGLTIADGSSGVFDGAGIRAGGNGLSISDCVITNNRSSGSYGGGGIFISPGVTLTVSNCTISGNSAASGSLGGGGIHNDQGVLSVVDCVFNGNSASDGGGIYNFYGTLRINTSTLSGNSASSDGGGIFQRSGVMLIVSNCTFSANGADGLGGGICNSNSTLTVMASSLSGNWANSGGGIMNNGAPGSATLTLIASTLSGNSASFGGGIMNNGESGSATLTLVASTLSTNSAYAGGGGILNWGESGGATLTLVASTFSGNSTAFGDGGGLMNNNYGGTGTVEIGDTIFQAGATGANLYNYSGPLISDGYNLSSDGGGDCLTNAADRVDADPLLGPLQDNGGPTWTHALLSGSPAIDQGRRNVIPAFARDTDQRGMARPVDFQGISNATGGDGSDIGAFESQVILGCNPLPLTGPAKLGNGAFQFSFTNTPGASFTVFTTTNVALPFSNWTVLGVPVEIAPGQFQFTDSQTTNSPQRFYRVTSP